MVRMKITCWDGRKFIGDYYIPDIEINKDHWDKKIQRLSYLNDNDQQNKSASTLNSYFDKVNDRIRYAKDKQAVKEYTIKQAFDYACGKSKIESVDGYINTVMSKYSANDATLRAYKGALGSFKKYTEFKNKEVPWGAFNYNTLDAFRIEYTKKWRKSSSNSVLKNLRAVLSNAQKRGYVSKDLEISNDLNYSLPPKKINTATTEEIIAGIEKCETIKDWQSVALWVLMFATRGMYLADIVKFKEMNVEDGEDFATWYADKVVLRHRRSKTDHTSNADMLIDIGIYSRGLIEWLKKSFVYTHYQDDPSIIGDPNDELSIFGYKPNANYSRHVSFWRYYQKKIKFLTGYTFKEARKTFNTIGKGLEIGDGIRKILLGQKGDPLLSGHYDNDEVLVIKKQVEDAHEKIMDEFVFFDLIEALQNKLSDIINSKDLPGWIMRQVVPRHLKNGMKYFTMRRGIDPSSVEGYINEEGFIEHAKIPEYASVDFKGFINHFKDLKEKKLIGEDEFLDGLSTPDEVLRKDLDASGLAWMPPEIMKIKETKKYETNAVAWVKLHNWLTSSDVQREIIRREHENKKNEKSKNKGIKKV